MHSSGYRFPAWTSSLHARKPMIVSEIQPFRLQHSYQQIGVNYHGTNTNCTIRMSSDVGLNQAELKKATLKSCHSHENDSLAYSKDHFEKFKEEYCWEFQKGKLKYFNKDNPDNSTTTTVVKIERRRGTKMLILRCGPKGRLVFFLEFDSKKLTDEWQEAICQFTGQEYDPTLVLRRVRSDLQQALRAKYREKRSKSAFPDIDDEQVGEDLDLPLSDVDDVQVGEDLDLPLPDVDDVQVGEDLDLPLPDVDDEQVGNDLDLPLPDVDDEQVGNDLDLPLPDVDDEQVGEDLDLPLPDVDDEQVGGDLDLPLPEVDDEQVGNDLDLPLPDINDEQMPDGTHSKQREPSSDTSADSSSPPETMATMVAPPPSDELLVEPSYSRHDDEGTQNASPPSSLRSRDGDISPSLSDLSEKSVEREFEVSDLRQLVLKYCNGYAVVQKPCKLSTGDIVVMKNEQGLPMNARELTEYIRTLPDPSKIVLTIGRGSVCVARVEGSELVINIKDSQMVRVNPVDAIIQACTSACSVLHDGSGNREESRTLITEINGIHLDTSTQRDQVAERVKEALDTSKFLTIRLVPQSLFR